MPRKTRQIDLGDKTFIVPAPTPTYSPPAEIETSVPAPPAEKETCQSCRWWDPRSEKDWGYCHRALISLPSNNQLTPLGLRGRYLVSAAGDWCSSHKAL